MAKVHPNAAVAPEPTIPSSRAPPEEELLTVWRKSLLFNCDGFTVFDAKGDLAFRVDCYASARRRAEVVLMDVAGKPLLTVRRKRLSLTDHWVIYDGDATAEATKSKPLLSVRRHVSLRGSSSKTLAHVMSLSSSASSADGFVVEGSYGRRACAVRDARGDAVAEVRRKESVGDDVFRLVADPRLGAPLAVDFLLLRRMQASKLKRQCAIEKVEEGTRLTLRLQRSQEWSLFMMRHALIKWRHASWQCILK